MWPRRTDKLLQRGLSRLLSDPALADDVTALISWSAAEPSKPIVADGVGSYLFEDLMCLSDQAEAVAPKGVYGGHLVPLPREFKASIGPERR